jgi:hypothetical protein
LFRDGGGKGGGGVEQPNEANQPKQMQAKSNGKGHDVFLFFLANGE